MKEHTLFAIKLNKSHKEESGSKRIIFGKECNEKPFELKIIRYDDDKGVYLIEYNKDGEEIIDTFHNNVKEAMNQAEFDWGVEELEWEKL